MYYGALLPAIRTQCRYFRNLSSFWFTSRNVSTRPSEDLEKKFTSTIANRNPRVIFEKTNTNTSARVVHWESHAVGSPVAIVSASTREPAIRAQLYSSSDVSAAQNIGRVLARRCLQCGIEAVHFERAEYVLDELTELQNADADREFYPDNTLAITHSLLTRHALEERVAASAKGRSGAESSAETSGSGPEKPAAKVKSESGKKSKKAKVAAETPASAATSSAAEKVDAEKKQEAKAETPQKPSTKEQTSSKPAESSAKSTEPVPKSAEPSASAPPIASEKKGKKSKTATATTDSTPKQVAPQPQQEAPKLLEAGLANQSIAAFCEALREAGVELQERPVIEPGVAPEDAEAYSEWREAAAWDEREWNASPEGAEARAPTLLERIRSDWDWGTEQWGYKRRPLHPDALKKNRSKRVLFDNTSGRIKKPENEYRY